MEQQDAEKVRQHRSHIAQRLNVPKRTPRLFARFGLAGQSFSASCVAYAFYPRRATSEILACPQSFFRSLLYKIRAP